MYFTYIVRCRDKSLYTGYTTDIVRRIREHKKGINSKYTRAKGFEKLEIYFITDSKSKAMKLECYIKKLSRKEKISIIDNPILFLKNIEKNDEYLVGETLDVDNL